MGFPPPPHKTMAPRPGRSRESTGAAVLDALSLEALRRFPLFADLSRGDLERLAGTAKRLSVSEGTVLLEEGTPGDRFYLILQGEMEITRKEGGRTAILDVMGPGGFLSEMSIIEEKPRSATARATKDCEVLAIEPEDFMGLLARSPGAALAMLRTVTARLRSTESALIAHGRMAGLGSLASGLAHELNNPAAAIVRSAALLDRALREWHGRCAQLGLLSLSGAEVRLLQDLEDSRLRIQGPPDSPSESQARQEEMEDWLASRGIEEGWDLVPILAEAGWDRSRLEDLGDGVVHGHLEPILRWVAAGAEAFALADEIGQAGRAISGIVSGVRSYSSQGEGPMQRVHVAESLATALSILKGKLSGGVTVLQDLPADLPAVEAHPGELSQVWMNLLDNAMDAMGGEGTLQIRGRGSEDEVVVEVIDTGPGIPPEIRPRIFDPFFTTKPEGDGTGLGLAITYGIVVTRCRGSIRVDSRPGRTVFEVALPTATRPPALTTPP